MKFIDIIKNVKRPDVGIGTWCDMDELSSNVGIDHFWEVSYEKQQEIESHFKTVPLGVWLCTDTHVGRYVILFGDEVVCTTYQPARKSDTEYSWVSKEALEKVYNFIWSYMTPERARCHILSEEELNEEVDPTYTVTYSSQLLHQKGLYNGVEVDITKERFRRYHQDRDGISRRITVDLPDGTSQTILLEEFKIPFNLREEL